MPPSISTGDDLYELVQGTYFDSIDAGDAETAVTALHEDVEWIHRQVWEHDGHASDERDTIHGRSAVFDLLDGRIDEMQDISIEHSLDEAIYEDGRGAFTGAVVGPEGTRQPFLGWVELTDGLISTYRITPE